MKLFEMYSKSYENAKKIEEHLQIIFASIATFKYKDINDNIDVYYKTISNIVSYLITLKKPNEGIPLLLNLLTIGSNNDPSILNPVYSQFLRICIYSKSFMIAKGIIEKEYGFDVSLTGIEAKDILLFYYYSGYIALILHNYRLAYTNFRTALLIPTDEPHLCQMQAAKKFSLVCCILDEVFLLESRIPIRI